MGPKNAGVHARAGQHTRPSICREGHHQLPSLKTGQEVDLSRLHRPYQVETSGFGSLGRQGPAALELKPG